MTNHPYLPCADYDPRKTAWAIILIPFLLVGFIWVCLTESADRGIPRIEYEDISY